MCNFDSGSIRFFYKRKYNMCLHWTVILSRGVEECNEMQLSVSEDKSFDIWPGLLGQAAFIFLSA